MSDYEDKCVDSLRLIQLLQLKLLVDFKKITDSLNLDYFLIAGSLLGSVRHGGFIPWDSDADVAMMRDDYMKLIGSSKLFGRHLFLQCDESDFSNKTGFAKLRLENTLFIEKGNKSRSGNHGLYIDIFPLDKDIKTNPKIRLLRHYVYRYLIRLKAFKNGKIISSNLKRTVLSCFICFPSYFVPRGLIKKLHETISQKYSKTETRYVNNFNSKYGLQKQFMALETYVPPSIAVFEGHEFKAPNDVHFWLKKIYGDYMICPKAQNKETNELLKRYDIDFGVYASLLGKREKVVLKKLGLERND